MFDGGRGDVDRSDRKTNSPSSLRLLWLDHGVGHDGCSVRREAEDLFEDVVVGGEKQTERRKGIEGSENVE